MRIFSLLILSIFLLSPALFAQGSGGFQFSYGTVKARSLGPATMSGRITCLEAVHNNPATLYIGAANGGVWKSTSGGASFQAIFDDYTQAIGSIAIDQKHPDTVWVGTGEPWVRNSVSVGDGIYLTTNGGGSWTFKGLPNSERIARIVVHPEESATIWVAVQGPLWSAGEERGVYKTTDFGETWERVLYVNGNTGCADLAIDPHNPDILYAAMWEHQRFPDFFNSGGSGSGLYRSTDGGKNWEELRGGLPEGGLGRIGIGVAQSDTGTLYISLECQDDEGKGLYRSDDHGDSWKIVSSQFGTKVRPFYFSRVVVDPTNAEKVYKCGLNLIVSDNGGEGFRSVGSNVHSDVHDVWVDPSNPALVYIATDGGLYRSLDGGFLFEMMMNLPLSQFYTVAVDNANPYKVYGGLQDNGCWRGPSAAPGGIQNADWEYLNGGDGFYCLPNLADPDIIYAESQEGGLVRYQASTGQRKDIRPVAPKGSPEYRWNWNAPVHISPTNPERLYFGAQYLFRSDDRGESWVTISPDLTTNDTARQRQAESGGFSTDDSGAENNTTIYAIAESPINPDVIWVGTDDGNIQVTQNGGKNWENVATQIPDLPEGLWVSSVCPGRFDVNTCYVTIDGHRSGVRQPFIYKTTDMGRNWRSLVTPDLRGYAHVILEDSESPEWLYLGTESGLFLSADGGQSWTHFTNGIPPCGVRSLALQERESDLVIGTHGRGIYILDQLELLRQVTPEVAEQTLHFFSAPPVILSVSRSRSWFGGAGDFAGESPADGATVAYYMKKRHVFGRMRLEVLDDSGNLIKELPCGKNAGINVVDLPIRLPAPKAAPTNNRMALFGSLATPTLTDGTYLVRITKGRDTFETSLELQFDPTLPYSTEDRALQNRTLTRLYDMTNRLGYIYFSLEDAHEQADALLSDTSLTRGPLTESLTAFSTDSRIFKESLVSMKGDFYVVEGSNLREDISKLYLAISGYPGKPSQSQLEQLEELEGRMENVEVRYGAMIDRLEEGNWGIEIEDYGDYLGR